MGSRHAIEHRIDFLPGKHNGQPSRAAGAHHAVEPWNLLPQNLAIQEQDGGQRLVLGGGRDMPLVGERRQERGHLRLPHLAGVAHAVVTDVAAHPVRIRPFRAQAVVARADGLPQARQKAGALGAGGAGVRRRDGGIGHGEWQCAVVTSSNGISNLRLTRPLCPPTINYCLSIRRLVYCRTYAISPSP